MVLLLVSAAGAGLGAVLIILGIHYASECLLDGLRVTLVIPPEASGILVDD
jgi:hypothetical protein